MSTLNKVLGQVVRFQLTTPDPVADSFPFDLAVPVPDGGAWESKVTGVQVLRAECATNPTSAVQVTDWSWADGVLTINEMVGLAVSLTYDVTLLCSSFELPNVQVAVIPE